jgi:hypothetical protein
MVISELAHNLIHILCLLLGVGVSNYCYRWLDPSESIEITFRIRLMEVVIEEANRQVHIGQPVELVSAVFPESGKESEPICIRCEWMTACISDVGKLLCFVEIDLDITAKDD